MSLRLRQLTRLQHSLFQANLLLGQRIHQMNFQLCAPEFSIDALRDAAARTHIAAEDLRACLDAIISTLADNDNAGADGANDP